jgi:hypothetical protein
VPDPTREQSASPLTSTSFQEKKALVVPTSVTTGVLQIIARGTAFGSLLLELLLPELPELAPLSSSEHVFERSTREKVG